MSGSMPTVSRVYQNHHLDSTRWECYAPREGDIIVTTAYKSGTTWTQLILLHLLHGDQDPLPEMPTVTKWVDERFQGTDRATLEKILDELEAPRFLKSHLPFDGLPYFPEARYLVIGRDPRDVFMSLFNHYSAYTDLSFQMMNGPGLVGDPLPKCPEDPRELWRDWITRGWFEWESEGWPFWSNLHHTQTYWEFRHLPNIRFLHYNDMLTDLDGKVREIADFCGIDASEERIAMTVEGTTFSNVKKKAQEKKPEEDMMGLIFEGGLNRFFNKGTNARWRGILTDEDLELYEEAKQRVLTPDCAKWLEEGGPVEA